MPQQLHAPLTGLLISIAALGTVNACVLSCLGGGWEKGIGTIELGVSADLHAVVRAQGSVDTRSYSYLAVGAGGTVVGWGEHVDDSRDRFVESWVVGDADLRAAWSDDSDWWVVGDAGMVARSTDLGETWTTVDLGTSSDLHAITSVEGRLVIVGDEVVRVRDVDGTWFEPPTPTQGWGRLRGLHHDDDGVWAGRTWAVGLDGVIWSTLEPGEAWSAESGGVTADLFAIGRSYYDERIVAVGEQGTVVVRDANTWTPVESGTEIDLVGYQYGGVLGAGGQVFELDLPHGLEHVETFDAGRAFVFDLYVVVVGDGGMAADKYKHTCE
jgi:hypothetical protein